jgi:hypothetical protein
MFAGMEATAPPEVYAGVRALATSLGL